MPESIQPNIHCVGDVESTMGVAREIMADANGAPYAVLSESQSKGRGTTGRTWVSPKGNMYFTLCVPEKSINEAFVPILPLITGLACRAAVMELIKGANVHVKWPNDIIYDAKKIGGSLVENEKEYLLIGIGMNVAVAPPVTDSGRPSGTVNEIATALGQPHITPKQLAEAVWRHFFVIIAEEGASREEIVKRFETAMDKSLVLHRRTPTGRDPRPLLAVRLNEWGHLTVLKPDGTEETLVAEYLF